MKPTIVVPIDPAGGCVLDVTVVRMHSAVVRHMTTPIVVISTTEVGEFALTGWPKKNSYTNRRPHLHNRCPATFLGKTEGDRIPHVLCHPILQTRLTDMRPTFVGERHRRPQNNGPHPTPVGSTLQRRGWEGFAHSTQIEKGPP